VAGGRTLDRCSATLSADTSALSLYIAQHAEGNRARRCLERSESENESEHQGEEVSGHYVAAIVPTCQKP